MKRKFGKKEITILLVLLLATFMSACNNEVAPTQEISIEDEDVLVDETSLPDEDIEVIESEDLKVVTMVLSTPWDTLSTLNTTSAYSDTVFDFLYDRLVVINFDGSFSPRLAESWEVPDSKDKIVVHIDKDAKWHDGEPVTSHDVVFTYQVVAHPNAGHIRSNRAVYFAGTDSSGKALPENLGIKALDDYTVEFTLKSPMDTDPIFAISFRDIFIIPEHIYGDLPIETMHTNELWNSPIGSGPCKFDSMVTGDRIEMVANKDYHLSAPDFDRYVIKVMPASNFLTGMISGDIDVVGPFSSIPLKDWAQAQELENFVTASTPRFVYQYFAVNTKKIPQEVRQAMNIAVNRTALVDQLLQGNGLPLICPLQENHRYYPESLEMEYNPEKAQQMIIDSGFDTSQELLFLVGSGDDLKEKTTLLVEQDLERIGLNVRIQLMDFSALLAATREGDFDLSYIGSAGALDPDESASLFTVGSNVNFSHLEDPRLGELAARAAQGISFEERKPIYDEYYELMYEMSPFIFLYSNNNLYAYNSKISNVKTENWFVNPCVWEWKVEP